MCGCHGFRDLFQRAGRRGPALIAHHGVVALRDGVQRQPWCRVWCKAAVKWGTGAGWVWGPRAATATKMGQVQVVNEND